MLNFVRKIKGAAALACVATAITFGFVGSCPGQTNDGGSAQTNEGSPAQSNDAGPAQTNEGSAAQPDSASPVQPNDASAAQATSTGPAPTNNAGPAQTDDTPASGAKSPPLIITPVDAAHEGCASVVLNCDRSSRFVTPGDQLVDSATARDQAKRKQAQADRAAADQALQRRIDFARTHPNAIFVYGKKSAPQESVAEVFSRMLGVSYTPLTTSSFNSSGDRTECVNACHGPACCVTTPSAADSR